MSQGRTFKCYYREKIGGDLLQKFVVATSAEEAGEFLSAMGFQAVNIAEIDTPAGTSQPNSLPSIPKDPNHRPLGTVRPDRSFGGIVSSYFSPFREKDLGIGAKIFLLFLYVPLTILMVEVLLVYYLWRLLTGFGSSPDGEVRGNPGDGY